MGALTNTARATTYGDLLQMDNAGAGITSALRTVKDGLGNNSGLALSTTGVGSNFFQPIQGCRRIANGAVTNSTNTMTNITDLSVIVSASTVYVGLFVIVANNSTAGEGLQFDFNGGNATISGFAATFAAAPASSVTFGTLTTSAIGTPLTITTATTANNTYIVMLNITVSGNGTFVPRFAENSAHVSGTATFSSASFLALQIPGN